MVIAVHGGCWSPPPESGRDTGAAHAALAQAVEAAAAALSGGGRALDGAQAAVELLEDDPQFNAGRGSVLTSDGTVEMDAAVMTADGAGAVAAVTRVRHAVALARAVMETTPHVMLAGAGAERVAPELERMQPEWFVAERRRAAFERGTVGAVVLDHRGALAAATSTGGTPGQLPGRVGDSPIPGAGTWADERVAISCTGDGEQMIRAAAAHTLAVLVGDGVPLAEAADRVVGAISGDAGLIAIDSSGNVVMPFNTTLMNRAWRTGDCPTMTAVWTDDIRAGRK